MPHDETATLTLCCLLWANADTVADMNAYEDAVMDLLADHGAEILHRLIGDGADGQPHEVQIYRFPGQDALDAFLADPRRAALAEERDRVIARTELFPVTAR